MKRKRYKDKWFQIGGVLSGRIGSEREYRKTPSQADYHFTRVDQVDPLVEANKSNPLPLPSTP
ncbi:MAG: hypothetical protein OXG96_00800 [Acidobacteria bacterium]|nr:hypothetical protein [Acidobacteriota bacterium]